MPARPYVITTSLWAILLPACTGSPAIMTADPDGGRGSSDARAPDSGRGAPADVGPEDGSAGEGGALDSGVGDAMGTVDAGSRLDGGEVPRRPPPDTGSELPTHETLQAIPFNTALRLEAFSCPGIEGGLEDGCRRLMEYSGFTYDRHRHQMLAFGGGHATTMNNDVERFDLTTLTWEDSYSPNTCASHTAANFDDTTGFFLDTGYPASTHTYDQLLVSETYGELLKFFTGGLSGSVCHDEAAYWGVGGVVHTYNPESRTWRATTGIHEDFTPYGAAELDPLEDWTVLIDGHLLLIYDNVSEARLFQASHGASDLSYAKNLLYYPPNRKFYYIRNGDAVFELTLDRDAIRAYAEQGVESDSYFTFESIPTSGDTISFPETGFAFDSHNELIGGGMVDGIFYAFDPPNRTWHSQAVEVDSSGGSYELERIHFHGIDFDPINGVYIFVDLTNSQTWAYRW